MTWVVVISGPIAICYGSSWLNSLNFTTAVPVIHVMKAPLASEVDMEVQGIFVADVKKNCPLFILDI